MLAAVNLNIAALQYASDELKKDKDLVMAAVKEDEDALEYAADELKNDENVDLMAGVKLGKAIVLLFYVFALKSFRSSDSADSSITYSHVNQDKLDDVHYTGEIPDKFICPITGDIMNDPAYFEGDEQAVHRFEANALIEWNTKNRQAHTFPFTFQLRHPWTNRPVVIEEVKIDSELKDEIAQFVDEQTNNNPNNTAQPS